MMKCADAGRVNPMVPARIAKAEALMNFSVMVLFLAKRLARGSPMPDRQSINPI
jgi:hypothetical protein